MNKAKEMPSKCLADPTGPQGEVDLCCCYAIDQEGNYTTPCHIPTVPASAVLPSGLQRDMKGYRYN